MKWYSTKKYIPPQDGAKYLVYSDNDCDVLSFETIGGAHFTNYKD